MPKIVRIAQSPSELRKRNGSGKSHGIVVALAGNPNSGKTTVFSNLTGGRQHVGNYAGVTVERKEGTCRHGEVRMRVVDLPGTYSLTAYSSEEVVARDFIIDERPDVVVDVIDSSNLERNLYLAVQIMELGVPLVLAFNMSDAARAQGCVFDTEKLSDLLGPPIVQTVGHKNLGMDELLDAVVATAQTGRTRRPGIIDYGSEIEEEVRRIQNLVTRADLLEGRYDSRWLATKVLENDTEMLGRINSPALDEQLEKSISHLHGILGEHARGGPSPLAFLWLGQQSLAGQSPPHRVGQLPHSYGLGHLAHKPILGVAGHHRIIGVPAGHDGARAGIDLDQALERPLAAHPAGDGQVHDDDIEGRARHHGLPVGGEGLLAVAGAGDLVAKQLQYLPHRLADGLIIVHQQDAARTANH